jgi:hypothetical protein
LIQIEQKTSLPRPALRGRGNFFAQPAFWLLIALALTALVYVPGLRGPFLFDDIPNLRPLQDWLSGLTGWHEVLFGNRSGLFGRPLSMLSFILDAKLFGMAPFSFKLTNLLIHLACGALIYALLHRLLLRDPHLHQRAALAALAISAIWLLHPLQVSTVLYIVQRMAQLSALFILLALLAYVHGREALEQGRLRSGVTWLFLAVPAATALGMLCKEKRCPGDLAVRGAGTGVLSRQYAGPATAGDQGLLLAWADPAGTGYRGLVRVATVTLAGQLRRTHLHLERAAAERATRPARLYWYHTVAARPPNGPLY